MTVWVTALAFVAAAVAAAWPLIARIPALLSHSESPAAFDRADWVTRLFALAAAADESGDAAVAAAARSLISSLVSAEPAKRGK